MAEEPAIGVLATAVGMAPIIWMIMTLVVRTLLDDAAFNRFAPTIAIWIGVVLALAYVIVTTSPITGTAILQGVLVGLFAGSMSQQVNNAVSRLQGNSPTPVA